MRRYRVIIWSEEVLLDRHPHAEPGALRIVRSTDMEFISSSNQSDLVKNIKATVGRLGARKACPC